MQLRHRQHLAVDLAVGGHRHRIELHIGIRHHIVGQRRGCEGGTDIFIADRGTFGHRIVEHQVFVAHHLTHLSSCLTDAVDIEGLAFDFAQFDTETAQFHLCVDTSQILQLSVIIPTAEVAGMIHADRMSPAVFFDKRAIDKCLRGTFGQSPVAASHLYAGKAQLASHTLGHEMSGGIDDKIPVVGHTLTDGNILHTPAWGNTIIRGVVGALRRTIHIDNLDVIAIDTIHLLAATRRKADGQVVIGVEQQTCHRRRIAATRNLVVDEELADSREVLAYLGRHDMERATQRQYRIHIFDMGIERERAVPADTVGSRQFLHIGDDSNKVAQACLMKHCTFGFACGA